MICPCKDCEYRREGCHSVCEPYKEFQAQAARIRQRRIEKCTAQEIDVGRARKKRKDHGWSLKRNK